MKNEIITENWFEVGINQGEELGTQTVHTCTSKEEAEEWLALNKNSDVYLDLLPYIMFIDEWTMVDGSPELILSK